MMSRPVSWYVDWLGRDASFSPQPYRQLAGVFREAGADDKANEILYALREREREEAWQAWRLWPMAWPEHALGDGRLRHRRRLSSVR